MKSAGTVDVNAKGKLLVTTEKQSSKEHYDFSDNHHYHLDKEGEVSSVIEGKEGTRLVGQEETTLRQAKVNSEEGRTIIASQGEVKLEEGRDIEHLDRRNKQTSKGFLTKETEEMRRHHDYDLSKGSEVNGKDVIVYSQDANATVKGSSITAQDGLLVQAKNVNVKEAENNAYVEEHYEKKRSGLATSFKGGVAKIGYEKSKSNLDSKSISLEAAGSQLTGGTTTLAAENVLTVRGSDLNSQEQSDLRAKQVNLEAAKEVHHTEVHQSSKTSGFGLSMVYDPTLKAIDQYKQRQKQGGTETVVGKINSIAEAGADAVELMSRGIVPYLEHKRSKSDKTTIETTAKVTAVNAGGQLNVVASEGDIRTQGTQIAAEKGATFLASNNIELGTAENTYIQQANTSDKGFSLGDANKYLFGVHTQRENGDVTQTQEVSTTISVGGNNQIVAQKGDIHAKGAKIVSEGKNQLSAAGNVVLDTAVTTQETTQQRKGHAVGEAVISDSERFYGYNRTRFNQDGNFTHHEKAQLASLGDKVEVYAGKDYRQTSAEILSKDKASINAQNIIVDSAFNTDKYKQSESDLKFGQFTRVKSPIIDLINSIESTVKNKKASDRVQAANIMSVAAQAYNLASAFQGQGGASYLIRVESGTGVAHSRKKEDSYQHTSQGNLFNAKEIEFTARGDGSTNAQGNPQLGNINITHADITSVDEKGNRLKDSSVTFNANNLTIDPGKSTVDQHARSQSAGVEVGMAATIGAQTGIGIYARVGGSSSKTNVEGVNYTNSHLNTETLNINTQGDTTLTGTTAKAKTINANVGGNLNIASVQDENKFETKSSGGGLEVEFGWGNNWRVSGYANSEKGESGYKQVKEQAGLFAEEGGYHVNAKNVHLKGAAITSTNPANSELATNKLTFEDIQNESHSDASSMSFSASYSKGGSAPKDNSSSGGSPFSQIGTKMKDSFSSNGPTSSSTSFGGGLPMNESDSDNSVTRATLTEGKITLNKDTAPMQTTVQALGINTDINQASGEVDKPKDVNQILSEQRQISAAAGNIKSAVNTYIETQRAPLLKEVVRLEEEKQALEARQDKAGAEAVAEQLAIVKNEAEQWSVGGKYYRKANAITSTIIAALSGQSAQGIAATAASPYVNVLIKEGTLDKETGNVNLVANTVAHALWGAVEAESLGGSGTSGALAAGISELSAPVVAAITQAVMADSKDMPKTAENNTAEKDTIDKLKILVDKVRATDPSQLSEKDKEMVVGITSLIGQAVAYSSASAQGADSYKASKNGDIGKTVAINAVANNWLLKKEIEAADKAYDACKRKADPQACREKIVREMNNLDIKREKAKLALYRDLQREYYQLYKQNLSACGGGASCVETAGYEARRKIEEIEVQRVKKMFPDGMITDKRSLQRVADNLVTGGYYPDGKWPEVLAAVRDYGKKLNNQVNNQVDYIKTIWNKNSLADIGKKGVQKAKGELENQIKAVKDGAKYVKNLATDPMAGLKIEEQIEKFTVKTAYDQTTAVLDSISSKISGKVSGKVSEKVNANSLGNGKNIKVESPKPTKEGYVKQNINLNDPKQKRSLNKPKPNTEYNLSNGHSYRTDHLGRVTEAKGQLILNKAERNLYQQRIAGGTCRQKNDCGGHLIASMFNGFGGAINLTAQDKILNGPKGRWYKLETQWANAIKKGEKVEVRIVPIYQKDSTRPTTFAVVTSINGKQSPGIYINNTPTGY